MENNSKKEQGVEPWCFQTKAINKQLFGWVKEAIQSSKNLNKESITRLQYGDKKGTLLALDTEGTLLYRNTNLNEWLKVDGFDSEKWLEIKNIKGGTFVSNDRGLALIKYNMENLPFIAGWSWERNGIEKLSLPIHDIAILYDNNKNSKLLIGSNEGLLPLPCRKDTTYSAIPASFPSQWN